MGENGLSPLARGTQDDQTPVFVYDRFIPADAGNTALAALNSSARTVYPRWRGEHKVFVEWYLN